MYRKRNFYSVKVDFVTINYIYDWYFQSTEI